MSPLDRSLIVRLPAFADYDNGELDEILCNARSIRRVKGAAVFEQGGAAHSFYLLLNGRLRAVKLTPSGQQVTIRYVTPGDLFGIAVAIGQTAYPATVMSVIDSVMLAWPSAVWPELSVKYPKLVQLALRTVGSRLLDAHVRIVEMSTEAVERRVAHTLLRLAGQAGRKVQEGIEIDFPISRQDVAEMAGTTLHTVSRILSAWEDRGLVVGSRQKIIIKDPHGLYVLSEGPQG